MSFSRASWAVFVVAQLVGCGDPTRESPDPLRPVSGPASPLADVSADLQALLEHGALDGACTGLPPAGSDRQQDRTARLRCGKSMFFYESFGTAGVPKSLVRFLLDNFPQDVGAGFARLGMVPDPYSAQHLPLGMVPTAKLGGKVDALAFTCASCHFAQLPDGRYAVGAPNHRYEYGLQNLLVAVLPSVALQGPAGHAASAVARVQPLLSRIQADAALKNKLVAAVLPLSLAGIKAPVFPAAAEDHYAAWRAGTMDFLIEPLPVNDGVHTVSKIPPLWELPTNAEIAASGMANALLGWTGNTHSLEHFCQSFVVYGGGPVAAWPMEKIAPLWEYVYSLRRPASPAPLDEATVAQGRRVFSERGCSTCHDGPRGSGKRVYAFDEIGSERALQAWLDPAGSGTPCCGAPPSPESAPTHGIKSPRLVGLFSEQRFLHNGSLDSLEQLFCLGSSRPTRTDMPFGDQGHVETCNDLRDDEKRQLIAYLLAN
ncbi:MAG: hypothetical protein JNJ46_09590 [Myxococcales bacterium]|nr:hypothetical protein [Myxococcales bacterium]